LHGAESRLLLENGGSAMIFRERPRGSREATGARFCGVAAVTRETAANYGWALAPLRVRRIERVRLHADLTILSRLTVALNQAERMALAA
jgi:hypothetical protein